MKKQKILITGGLGFIFSHVSEFFASKGHNVTIIDNLSDGSHPELIDLWKHTYPNIKIITNDVCDISNLSFNVPDIIIHAADSDVDKSILNQSSFVKSNIDGVLSVLEYIRNSKKIIKLLYVNTDEVYGSTTKWCSSEDKLNPSNLYSAGKASAGHLCWAYKNTYQLNVREIRMCNIIGKRQANTKLLPRVIENALLKKPVPLYDGGKFTREYMDVRDVPNIINMVLEDNSQEIFNLTFNQELSILEVIKEVENILGFKIETFSANRLGHDQSYRMIPSRILFNETGERLSYTSIKNTISWMLENC